MRSIMVPLELTVRRMSEGEGVENTMISRCSVGCLISHWFRWHTFDLSRRKQ
jgi:hypothetical protein